MRLSVVLLLLALALPAGAVPHDNLGRPLTPEAGVLGTASASATDSTTYAFVPHMLDLSLAFGATGQDNGAGIDEAFIYSASLLAYVNGWLCLGPQMTRSAETPQWMDFTIPLKAYIFQRPDTAMKPYVRAELFTYTARTSRQAPAVSSAWSFDPKFIFGVELPQAGYSLDFDLGAEYTLTQLGDTVNQFGGLAAAARVNVWLGR